MKKSEVLIAIAAGDLDADLVEIMEAARHRDKQVARLKFRQGDEVVLNSRTRPGYLIGRRARVMELTYSKVKIQLAASTSGFAANERFRAGQTVTCPPEYLDLVKNVGGEAAAG